MVFQQKCKRIKINITFYQKSIDSAHEVWYNIQALEKCIWVWRSW